MEEATGAEFSDVWEKHMRATQSVWECVCDSEAPNPQRPRSACDWTPWTLGYMPGKHEQYRVGKHGVFLTRSQMCRRAAWPGRSWGKGGNLRNHEREQKQNVSRALKVEYLKGLRRGKEMLSLTLSGPVYSNYINMRPRWSHHKQRQDFMMFIEYFRVFTRSPMCLLKLLAILRKIKWLVIVF